VHLKEKEGDNADTSDDDKKYGHEAGGGEEEPKHRDPKHRDPKCRDETKDGAARRLSP
jgi:hypothetical protein